LTDEELAAVVTAAACLPIEKRDLFLQRLSARLLLQEGTGFGQALRLALAGLIHDVSAA
jgi:hypothetical protein